MRRHRERAANQASRARERQPVSEPLDPRDAIKSALHRVLVQDRFNSEWGSAAAALEALDALAAEVRQLREALAIADRDIRLGIREAVFSTPIGKPFTETLRLTIADRCQIAETNIAAALAAEAAR